MDDDDQTAKLRALIVDDDELLRSVMAFDIAGRGFEMHEDLYNKYKNEILAWQILTEKLKNIEDQKQYDKTKNFRNNSTC